MKVATSLSSYVTDLDDVVDELGSNGVTCERYDDPDLKADEKGDSRARRRQGRLDQ
jgi:hypothetical protein